MLGANNEKENKKNFVNYYHQSIYICKEINNNIHKNYQKGKNEAYDEMLQWLSNNYASDKTISVNAFNLFLQDKLNKINSDIDLHNGGGSANGNGNSHVGANRNNGFDMSVANSNSNSNHNNGSINGNHIYEEEVLSNPNLWTFVSSNRKKK